MIEQDDAREASGAQDRLDFSAVIGALHMLFDKRS
jgi:hypothetical protein